MIVYVATWPRCGNSVLRDLFWLNWRVTVTDPYMPESGLATWRRIMTEKHGIVIDPDEPQIFRLGPNAGLVPGWQGTEAQADAIWAACAPVAAKLGYHAKTPEPPRRAPLQAETVSS
jgi:hypothetical protein